MKFRLALFCLVLCPVLHGQGAISQWNIAARLNRLDFFLEGSVCLRQTAIKHELGAGFGVNRSVFQQRAFPEVFYGLSTNFTAFRGFSYQGTVSYHLSAFQANRQQSEIHFFNEALLGIYLGIGKKYRFFIQPQAGIQVESFHSDFFKRNEHHYSPAYSAKLGFTHEF